MGFNMADLAMSTTTIEFFVINTKLPEMAILASKDFTAAKMLPPVGLDLVITGSGDYHWFKSPVLNQPLVPILPFLTTLNQL